MTVDSDTIQMDVSDDDGQNAFLSSFEDDEPKKKAPPSSEVEEASHAPKVETAETEAEVETADDEAVDPDDPDEQEIEVKVGEETKKAKLRELKRLFGQEAALTQKSQAASESLKQAEAQILRATTATKALLTRAEAAYEPYKALDMASWAQLATQMSQENYNQLREDAAAAKTNVDFLGQELDGLVRADQQKAQELRSVDAKAAVAELSDPVNGIKGWGKPLYDELVAFSAKQGLPEFNSVVNAKAIRLMHMAMLYAKSQEAAKAAEAKVKAAVDKPRNVLRPGSAKPTSSNETYNKAMKVLRQTGDVEDAAAAFAASFDA